jgi:hypothetical protein
MLVRLPFATYGAASSVLNWQRTTRNQTVQQPPHDPPDRADPNAAALCSFTREFSRMPVHATASAEIQSKLVVDVPGDIYEEEADRVSDQVMRMPDPETMRKPTWTPPGFRYAIRDLAQIQTKSLNPALPHWIQRQIGKPEIEDELVRALEATGATVQRHVDDHNEQAKDENKEQVRIARGDNASPQRAATGLESTIQTLEGGGQPLSRTVRNFMEPRFGRDFSHVRVHTDAKANDAARALNAFAFTLGRNVGFAAGRYAPETSAGQSLLAHELTHVMQQNHSSSTVKRKIIIGGKPYSPTASYYQYLSANFGPPMVEFIKKMHNEGKPPDYTFASTEQMGYEVRVRYQITKGMDQAHSSSCQYPDSAHPDYIDRNFWVRKGWMHFVPKSPLPAGKEASDAIEAIFGPDTRLECMSMTVAVEYYSLLKGLGRSKFNALFPGGTGLEISTRLGSSTHPTFYGAKKLYKNITISSKTELLPGDWVYFKNFKDYLVKHPGTDWQGENAIYMGVGKYRGFGVKLMSEVDMNKELIKAYTGKSTVDSAEIAALLAEGGGLQLSPVFRPDINKLAP